MFKYRLTKIILILAFAFLLFVIFWRPIASSGINYYVKHLSHKYLDAKFKASSISFDRGMWVIRDPHLETKKSLADGGFHFHCEQIGIEFVPKFFDRRVEIIVTLEKPNIELQKVFYNEEQEKLKPLVVLGLIHIPCTFSLREGTLTLRDQKPQVEPSQKIYFQLDGELDEILKGRLVASLDDPTLKNNCLILSLAEKEQNQLAIDFSFDEVECGSLLKAATPFFPALQGVSTKSGLVKGKMALTLPESGPFFAQGEVAIQNLTFSIPELELDGSIKEAQIHLDENSDPRSKNTQLQNKTIPRTIGHLELTEGATLAFNRDGDPFCAVTDLKGALYFQTEDGARLAFNGKCFHHDKVSDLRIGGEARFATESDGSLHLNFSLGDEKEKAEAKFFTRQLGSKLKFAEISFANVGPAEFDILTAILTPRYPESRQVHMTAGKIDATALAFMKGLRVTELKIEKMSGQNLRFDIDPWEWSLTARELSGNLGVNLDTDADKALDTLTADLLIKNGQVRFATFDNDFCHLSDVQTELTIRQGTILESIVQGELGGLKGTIRLNGLSPDGEILKFNFRGGTKGLVSISPEPIRSGIKKQFANDQLLVVGGVCFKGEGVTIEGKIEVESPNQQDKQTIEFGFDLDKTSERLWNKWPPNQQTISFWEDIGKETYQAYFPALAAPTALYESKWLLSELGIAGFVIRDGWIDGQNLPLKKYAAPFLFPENNIKLEGYGDIQGEFDHAGIALQYDFHDMVLESNDLMFEVKSPIKKDETTSHELPCVHFFDFLSGTSYGAMPLYNGSCFEKNSGLLFSDVNGVVSFNGKKIVVDDLQTYCTGLFFAGKLETDFSNPIRGLFDVDIKAHTIKGTFSQLQHFLSHFEKLKFFQKFPLEGNLELLEDGLEFHMGFNPAAPLQIQTALKGKLFQGYYIHPQKGIDVKNLTMTFDYNQNDKAFDISDINGTLLVGKDGETEEYVIRGDQIFFSNLDTNESLFDIWIGDSKRDIFRIVGKTFQEIPNPEMSLDAKPIIRFAFDNELTHFGDVHPKTVEFSLKNWSEVNDFKLGLELSLATLLNDLQAACRTEIFNLPPYLLKEISNLKEAKGLFAVNVRYDSDSSFLNYDIKGEKLAAGPYCYEKCCLQASNRGNLWSIEQLILDNLSLAADLTKIPTGWKVDFLGLKYGESLLIGLEGEYRTGESYFDSKVNLVEVNFSKLGEWPFLSKFMNECNPKGCLKGSGQLRFEIDPSTPKGWRFNAKVHSSLKDWQFKGLHFLDTPDALFHLISDKGIKLQNVKTSLTDGLKENVLADLEINTMDYLFAKDELLIDRLHFDVPKENLKTTSEKLQASFPEAFPEKVATIVSQAKEEGHLSGAFKLLKTPATLLAEVTLDDGQYQFLNQLHDVKNFILKYDLKELKVQTLYKFNNYPIWLIAKTKGPEFNSGVLQLSDHHPSTPPTEKYPLRVDWKNIPESGFQVYRALGHLGGMAINLTNDPEVPFSEENLHLVGEVGVNPSISAALVSEDLCQKAKAWELGEGYRLKGKLTLGKQEKGKIRFDGNLEGYDFAVKGYQLQKLVAKLLYQPGRIQLKDIEIEDPAGQAKISQADVYQLEEGDWAYHIPKVNVNNFKPSLLREMGQPIPIPKPLLVRNLEIENLLGYCDDINTLTGRGKLQFVNPPKKNLQNTILAIPAEILTRLGLDLTVLNPVSGIISYEIGQSKVFLTKFKDIYSEGKLSKFYLGSSDKNSYVDFDGKLHVSIRMKQYNLFFKLAELFTFNIGGTLQKPTYSLQNPRHDKKQNP